MDTSTQIADVGMSDYDLAVHYVARQLYLSFCNTRGYDNIAPPPFAPRWTIEYAQIAVSYLGYDREALDQLAQDYK